MSNQSLWLSTHPLTRCILFNISRLSLLDFGTALSKVLNFPFLLIWRYFHDTLSIINHTAFIARLDELKIRLPETPRLSIGHVMILFGDDWTNFESLSGSLWDTQRVDHRGVGCKNNRKKSIRYKSYWGHPNSQSNFFFGMCVRLCTCVHTIGWVWRLEENFQEFVLSATGVAGIELSLPGLTAHAFVFWVT